MSCLASRKIGLFEGTRHFLIKAVLHECRARTGGSESGGSDAATLFDPHPYGLPLLHSENSRSPKRRSDVHRERSSVGPLIELRELFRQAHNTIIPDMDRNGNGPDGSPAQGGVARATAAPSPGGPDLGKGGQPPSCAREGTVE